MYTWGRMYGSDKEGETHVRHVLGLYAFSSLLDAAVVDVRTWLLLPELLFMLSPFLKPSFHVRRA